MKEGPDIARIAGLIGDPARANIYKYFSLANEDVARVLESLMGLAARSGHLRTRTGPKDPALRKARVCYNHLAGDLGIQMFDALTRHKLLRVVEGGSGRRSHLAGSLGRAFLARIEELGWAKRIAGTRIVDFSRNGEKAFSQTFEPRGVP